ncbi:hypothetical protein A0H81_05275 [Grifola frondosa]|uniref:Uncharacterized protein n=1 Tax=Grifola frondosa TaxID=5627 RepID=A0A1C7MCJ6_GRIFR|nr:hypothetical protein A0H81_05275 [Grifola frondosa]
MRGQSRSSRAFIVSMPSAHPPKSYLFFISWINLQTLPAYPILPLRPCPKGHLGTQATTISLCPSTSIACGILEASVLLHSAHRFCIGS